MLPSMAEELTAGQKAARTRKRRATAAKALKRRRINNAFVKARAAEGASKEAFAAYCKEHGWKVAFFEGATGSPRTGIIDAVAFRIAKGKADVLDLRLIQLKGGKAGMSGPEIVRLKKAVGTVFVDWHIAAFDGEALHLVPDLK
jgi:cytochrome c5